MQVRGFTSKMKLTNAGITTSKEEATYDYKDNQNWDGCP